jgi:hypothetical protein
MLPIAGSDIHQVFRCSQRRQFRPETRYSASGWLIWSQERKEAQMLSILEAHYAHVIERLLKAWGSPADFGALYDDLYFDTRPVHRSGWPEDVQEELQLLRKVHELAYETEAEDCATESVDELKWV